MSEYSVQEVARRAGVDPAYVKRLVELGILTYGMGDTLSGGDVPRTRLVHTLEEAGAPLDGIAAVIRSGDLSLAFMDQPFYERFASLSRVRFCSWSSERRSASGNPSLRTGFGKTSSGSRHHRAAARNGIQARDR